MKICRPWRCLVLNPGERFYWALVACIPLHLWGCVGLLSLKQCSASSRAPPSLLRCIRTPRRNTCCFLESLFFQESCSFQGQAFRSDSFRLQLLEPGWLCIPLSDYLLPRRIQELLPCISLSFIFVVSIPCSLILFFYRTIDLQPCGVLG